MPAVVISPFNVVNFPVGGGHFWVYQQYAQGLRQLGCDVYWLEQFRPSGSAGLDEAVLSTFCERMEQFGLAGKSILYIRNLQTESGLPQEYVGLSRSEAEAIFESADLL